MGARRCSRAPSNRKAGPGTGEQSPEICRVGGGRGRRAGMSGGRWCSAPRSSAPASPCRSCPEGCPWPGPRSSRAKVLLCASCRAGGAAGTSLPGLPRPPPRQAAASGKGPGCEGGFRTELESPFAFPRWFLAGLIKSVSSPHRLGFCRGGSPGLRQASASSLATIKEPGPVCTLPARVLEKHIPSRNRRGSRWDRGIRAFF